MTLDTCKATLSSCPCARSTAVSWSTTLLDPRVASPYELDDLYSLRWEIDIYQTYNLHKSEVRYDFALARSALSLASSASSA